MDANPAIGPDKVNDLLSHSAPAIDNPVEAARAIAERVHAGQTDKAGKPYIQHVTAVASKLSTTEEKTVGLLHDVVEDTDTTLDDLRQRGFSEDVVAAVDAITRRDTPEGKEPEEHYIARVLANPLATRVKIADLAHNSDLSRLPHPTERDRERARKYLRESYALRTVRALQQGFDQTQRIDPAQQRQAGKLLRKRVPRSSFGAWQPSAQRPSPIDLLREQGESRVQELLPLRYERMGASAFAFFRGGALIMASDLAPQARTGITVQACGDAHISNFGIYASPERRLVFDINDFDETLPGPWEWDIERLAASVEICGRDRGFSPQTRAAAVKACAQAYREGMLRFASMGHLDVWYAHVDVQDWMDSFGNRLPKGSLEALTRIIGKAQQKNNSRAVSRLTETVDGHVRIKSQPPLLVPLRDFDMEKYPRMLGRNVDAPEALEIILHGYLKTLPASQRALVRQYRGVDLARKVVGVGSVGTRAWIAVFEGSDAQDPLVLQIKEAQESVLERFVGASSYAQHGQRVVEGQRAIQMSSDVLLGWTRAILPDGSGRDFYVRQLWDSKGSIDLARVSPDELEMFAILCGFTLAHAHARTGDRFAIAGYLGSGDVFDKSMVSFAQAYADQNERDFAAFTQAREQGLL